MAGPIGMIRVHDFRDWAQRQSDCHDYFCHRKSFWHDAWWQLHRELLLLRPPKFRLEWAVSAEKQKFPRLLVGRPDVCEIAHINWTRFHRYSARRPLMTDEQCRARRCA